MDFLIRLKEYIEQNVTLNASIEPGLLSSNPQSVALRETPGNIPERYWDKSKTYEFNFQLLVKDTDYLTGSNQCHTIEEQLDGLPPGSIVSQDGSFIFTKCETYVTTNFVEKNEHGEYIFTAMFVAELEKGGA